MLRDGAITGSLDVGLVSLAAGRFRTNSLVAGLVNIDSLAADLLDEGRLVDTDSLAEH